MPLGLFNSQPEKTNIDLNYSSVVENIKKNNSDASYSLNIEEFVEQEEIDLGQHQAFFKKEEQSTNITLSDIKEKNTRALVNSFTELNEKIPDIKHTSLASIEKANTAISMNEQTIQLIKNGNIAL